MATFQPKTVDVNVFRETRPVSVRGLEYPMVLIPHNISTKDVDTYATINAAILDGFVAGSPAYSMINNCFGGIAAPDLVKIGRLNLVDTDITVIGVPDADEQVTINLSVNGVTKQISYTVILADTATDVAAGLAAAATLAFPQTDLNNPVFSAALGVMTVTPSVQAGAYSYSAGWADAYTSVVDNTDDVLSTRLASIVQVDSDFFFLLAETHDIADQTALAAYAEANAMFYVTSTQDADNKDSQNTTAIMPALFGLGYSNTLVSYTEKADREFSEASIVGNWADVAPYKPFTLNLQTLKNVTPSTAAELPEGDRITINNFNGNYYVREHGLGVFKTGVTPSGDFADTIRFSIWIQLQTEISIFQTLKGAADRASAIPYSDAGALILKNRYMNDVINVGIRGGAILTGYSTDPDTGSTINLNPVVNFRTRAQQTNNNIASRFWDDVLVEVVYAGAIHNVKVNVFVILNREPQL